MSAKSAIESFLSQKRVAVVGVSRSGRKFGAAIYRELQAKGYKTFAVNQKGGAAGEIPLYANLTSIPEPVDGIVTVIPPRETDEVVDEAIRAGIKHIWMQQGSKSEKAAQSCRENGINVVPGECILMFLEPVTSIHRLHRWIWRLLGKAPQ